MFDFIMNLFYYLGLVMLILVPLLTVVAKRRGRNRYVPSVGGVVLALFIMIFVAPNTPSNGGFSDMITFFVGIVLIIISLLVLGGQLFIRDRK